MSTTHNPTNFEPRDYEVLDYLDNRRPEYFGQPAAEYEREVKWWETEMANALGPDWRAKSHHCVHCGNGMVRWITACLHKPSGERVVFGAICTDRLGFANKMAFKLAQIQARAEARKVRFTIYNKRLEFLKARPELAACLERLNEPSHKNNSFVHDVFGKLDKWGNLSEAQVSAVIKSMARDDEWVAKKALEDAEPKGPAPSGRVSVSGKVLSTKWVETGFGNTLKMLVKLENNAKVWVSVPSKETIERGDKIRFTASFEVSRDDPHFAFGKRPTLHSRVEAAAPDPPPAPTLTPEAEPLGGAF